MRFIFLALNAKVGYICGYIIFNFIKGNHHDK
jgi:hypothetical protein